MSSDAKDSVRDEALLIITHANQTDSTAAANESIMTECRTQHTENRIASSGCGKNMLTLTKIKS